MTEPAKDFFVRAAFQAKKMKLSEINSIETDLIMLEEQLISLDDNLLPEEGLQGYQKTIDTIRSIIKKKKEKYR